MKIVLSEAAIEGVLYKKVFLKFAKFTEKRKVFFNKFAGAAMSLLIVLTWKPLNIAYKVLPKENL